tara:strand:+ start:905 stop:1402 length:498 start_codon:yes stop_codon:yes gene_type:complete
MKIHVFFAHPATMTTIEIKESTKLIEEDMLGVIAGKSINEEEIGVIVVSGRKDHKHFFPQAGSWEKWTKDVVSRKNATTKRRMYDMFVVPGETCGSATKSIVENAMQANRAVFSWNDQDREFTPVIGTKSDDALDWNNGTRLIHRERVVALPMPTQQLSLFPEET